MGTHNELKVLLAGPSLSKDKALRKRLAGDYVLVTADSVEQAEKAMQSVEIDVVISEQLYDDGKGVDFLQRMRVRRPHAIRFLVLVSARREEIVKAINDAAIYQVILAPWEPEQISLMLKRALESRELARIHRYLSRELKLSRELRFAKQAVTTDPPGVNPPSPESARSRPQPGRLFAVEPAPAGSTLKEAVEQLEACLVSQCLERHNWNNSRASRELGLSRLGLANKIRRYGLVRTGPRNGSRI